MREAAPGVAVGLIDETNEPVEVGVRDDSGDIVGVGFEVDIGLDDSDDGDDVDAKEVAEVTDEAAFPIRLSVQCWPDASPVARCGPSVSA